MPARSSESKTGADGVVEKLRVRRPCSRISNPRTRSESCRRMQRRSGMIVTMSVEQSGGIALKTAEGIAASHTRQVSTTSTLFGPLGVSIGVVCESTTENKEVVVDMKNCSKDNTNLAIDWNVTAPEYENLLKNTQNRPPLEFRKSLSFLADRQFEMLSLLNVKSIQHLLDMPLRKVLEIKLSNQQLQLLLAMLETEVNTSPKSLKLSSEKMESLKSIAEELDKIDLNDDDDEQPLVIDETISNIEENKTLITKDNERSVDAIEECFSKIRNVKIPQTRAALKDVRSELTEMIAELNEKENRLSRQLQQNNQLADAVNNKESTGHDNEDVVTTTTAPTQQNLQPTVLIKKLSTPLRKREHNVDADSTTTSIELCSSKEKKLETNDNENVSCAQSRDVHVSKKTKIAQYPKKTRKRLVKVVDLTDDSDNPIIQAKPNYFSDISDNSDDLAEVCVSESSFMMEGIEVQASDTNLASVSHESEMNDAKHNSKSVSPASPLFESIKSDLEENDIINDREQKGPLITCELVDDLVTNSSIEESRNQTVSSYCSITPKDKEKCEDSIIHSPAQRRIEFDAKSCTKTVDDYSDNDKDDSHNAALTVKIANTPLSPISSGITSPINTFTFREYKPTAEIDGCCAEIIYLLKEIDIPNIPVNKPDDLDLLLRTNSSDPRLFKYLKKNANAVHGASSLCVYSKVSQSDPRRSSSIYNSDTYLSQRPQEPSQQTPNMLLYGCLQRSPWYQSLMSTMKIQINQTVSVLVHAINSFQKMRLEYPNAVFDIFKLYCAGELLEILENLGLFVDVNGVISEKKNVSSFAGRSYGCSSVVNATYSFIQPVEPPSVTVQHQQMRSFTAPSANFSAPSATFQQPSPSPSPFISCYIDSPQMAMEKPVQLPKPSLPRPSPITYSRRPTLPQQPPSSPPPRRHCGLKVPYSSRPPRHLWSPIKRQASYSDSEEECWDSDDDTTSSRPSKLPLSPDGSDSSHNSYEVPHRNYSKTEKFVEGRSSNYGKSLESAKKRY
ncbi:uncharacterized protein LOC128865396 isoform X5 [Anastrepha ludens]|uniref:uncharacterized protein LOC128865396 isoform X5 n=1 Tax=Anastrepha ludens TaxID=28586 RepID=UPI0023AF937A|nr:uncharacterized protein LOC128865396 isoform X5 [Anastrepha ludens]